MIAAGQNFDVDIDQIATVQGKTYAIYTTSSPWPTGVPTPTAVPSEVNGPPVEVETHLAVSSDGLRTWQAVDDPILALVGSKHQVKQFWAQSDTGGQVFILADVETTPAPTAAPQPDTLWVSHDGGTHWTELPSPDLNSYLAQATPSSDSWYICGSSSDSGSHGCQSLVTACSLDGGQTWIARPLLRVCDSCAGQPVGFGDSYIARDGSLVGLFPYGNAQQLLMCCARYRLPANSLQWQYLGQAADSNNGLMYAPGPSSASAGYLWAYGGSTGGDDLSATVGQTGNATSFIYTASYP